MRTERAGILAAVIALHAALFLLLRLVMNERPVASPPPELVFVAPMTILPVAPQPQTTSGSPSSPTGSASLPRRHRVVPSARAPTASLPGKGPSPPEHGPTLQPPRTDWAGQAAIVAGQWADAQLQRDRQALALSSRYTVVKPYVPHPYRIKCFPLLFLALPTTSCGMKDVPPEPYDPEYAYFKKFRGPPSFSEWTIEGRVP